LTGSLQLATPNEATEFMHYSEKMYRLRLYFGEKLPFFGTFGLTIEKLSFWSILEQYAFDWYVTVLE
jgi:hypothetical protein